MASVVGRLVLVALTTWIAVLPPAGAQFSGGSAAGRTAPLAAVASPHGRVPASSTQLSPALVRQPPLPQFFPGHARLFAVPIPIPVPVPAPVPAPAFGPPVAQLLPPTPATHVPAVPVPARIPAAISTPSPVTAPALPVAPVPSAATPSRAPSIPAPTGSFTPVTSKPLSNSSHIRDNATAEEEGPGAACELGGGRAGVCRPASQCAGAADTPCPSRSSVASPLACCDSIADRMCRIYIETVYRKGQSKKRKRRAVGGKKAKACEFPHMAMIGYGESINDTNWNCGGALISDQFVLTAGHCLYTNLGEARWVRLGALNKRNDSQTQRFRDFPVAERVPHPLFRRDRHYNDIGLLRLGARVGFSSTIRPACLHAHRRLPHRSALATGWGATQPLFDDGSEHLMKVRLDIQKVEVCEQAFSGERRSSFLDKGVKDESMICAGRLEGGKDTCKGDSGGPLQSRLAGVDACAFAVLGVTSFGKQLCGAPNAPGVYTRVSHFAPWVEGVVWREQSGPPSAGDFASVTGATPRTPPVS